MRTLVDRGYVRQQPVPPLRARPPADPARRDRRAGCSAPGPGPYLAELIEATGETANMAVLDGDEVVYVAQVPSRHSMRMFTEVGRRVTPHCTGGRQGRCSPTAAGRRRALLGPHRHAGRRPSTPSPTPDALLAELAPIRAQGYALDDDEQEIGVRCSPWRCRARRPARRSRSAGPEARMARISTDEVIPLMQRLAKDLSAELSTTTA